MLVKLKFFVKYIFFSNGYALFMNSYVRSFSRVVNKNTILNQVWWCKPLNPAFGEQIQIDL